MLCQNKKLGKVQSGQHGFSLVQQGQEESDATLYEHSFSEYEKAQLSNEALTLCKNSSKEELYALNDCTCSAGGGDITFPSRKRIIDKSYYREAHHQFVL